MGYLAIQDLLSDLESTDVQGILTVVSGFSLQLARQLAPKATGVRQITTCSDGTNEPLIVPLVVTSVEPWERRRRTLRLWGRACMLIEGRS